MFDKQVYQDTKRARHQTQAAHLATVMALPERARAGTLFALWPERLPRLVRSQIDKPTLAAWRALREAEHDSRWEAIDMQMDAMKEVERQQAIAHMLMDEHGEAVGDITALIKSLTNLKKISINAGSQLVSFDLENGEEVDHADLAIAMALHVGGGIVIRQSSALRAQVKDTNGQMNWVQQERVYGIGCAQGKWFAMSESEMRTAYNHDQQGNPLPHDGATTFGSLREQARKFSAKRGRN